MATVKKVDFERSGFGRTIKITALVLILAAGALATDHLVFVGASTPAAAASVAKAETVTPGALDGFALPENLKPTAADAVTGSPTF